MHSMNILRSVKCLLRFPPFFFQRITAAQIGPGLVYFGRSVAGGLDLTTDGLPDIIVGSLGNLTVLR